MNYTGIVEAGNLLAEILQDGMVPDVVKRADQIGLCAPWVKEDFNVRIWLYDIRECEELRSHKMRNIDSMRQKYPSSYVNLFYSITACSNGDIRYQAKEEQYMLGKIIQILKDHAVIENVLGTDGENGSEFSCSITLQNLPLEDKIRIFNVPGMGYRTSLFYEVGPIEIESEQARKVTRVTDARFDMQKL